MTTTIFYNEWRANTGTPWTLIIKQGNAVKQQHFRTEAEARAAEEAARS